jgi:hypothetical protein
MLMENEGRYNILGRRAAQEVYVVFGGQINLPPTTLAGQVESQRSMYTCSIHF